MIELGQTLFYVRKPGHAAITRHVTVTKIGRSWIYLDNNARINPITLIADGGGMTPTARCYLSEQDYLQETANSIAWNSMRKAVAGKWETPEGVTFDAIGQAMVLLGLADQTTKKVSINGAF